MAAVRVSLCTLSLVLAAVLLVEGRPDFQSKSGEEKDKCSICKDFVESFEKVQLLLVSCCGCDQPISMRICMRVYIHCNE